MIKLLANTGFYVIIAFCFAACNHSVAQINLEPVEIPIYTFEELEPLLNKDTDKTYIVNFWATWCKPCVAELPFFIDLYEAQKDQDVELILVSLDFKKQIANKLLPFVLKHDIADLVVVLSDPDANSWINKINPEWSGAIPATIIYNRENRLFHEGDFSTKDELEEMLLKVIEN